MDDTITPNAEIVVADKTGKTKSWGRMMKEPYAWCYIGGKQWYRVDVVPIPKRENNAKS